MAEQDLTPERDNRTSRERMQAVLEEHNQRRPDRPLQLVGAARAMIIRPVRRKKN
jgi:hypothetical protein